MTMKKLKILAISGIASLLALSAPLAAANEPDFVSYKVKPNDTLYGIAGKYLINSRSALELQRINRVRNARQLPINRVLQIPRRLLGYDTVELRVAAFSGSVEVGGNPPALGQSLDEGELIRTRGNGFITLSGEFGGRISVPSNTTARLVTARRYKLGNALDVDFEVIRGRADAISPTLQGSDRLRMRTPVAVTAVRGTQFRIGYDPDNGGASLTEVTEGAVNVAAGGEEGRAPAGFGIASTPEGVSDPEELLPVAMVNTDGALQTGELLSFAIEPVEGAQGYRVQLANDASFLDIIGETIIDGDTVELPGIDNGRYHVRARAIAPSGLEGNQESLSFLRKRVGASASAGTAPGFDGYKFGWIPEGGENATFAFQLWREGSADKPLVDELGLAVTELALTNLSPGRYQWRVAAIEADPEFGLIKVWSEPQTLVVSQ